MRSGGSLQRRRRGGRREPRRRRRRRRSSSSSRGLHRARSDSWLAPSTLGRCLSGSQLRRKCEEDVKLYKCCLLRPVEPRAPKEGSPAFPATSCLQACLPYSTPVTLLRPSFPGGCAARHSCRPRLSPQQACCSLRRMRGRPSPAPVLPSLLSQTPRLRAAATGEEGEESSGREPSCFFSSPLPSPQHISANK